MEQSIQNMKNEADGFRYVFNKINHILIDNFFGEKSAEIVEEIDLINPGITNGCFACELYLKMILKIQKKEIKTIHNLKKLFYSINGKTQNTIINRFIEKGYTKELFTRKLKYIANGYNISRYEYENNETYYMLSDFIYEFIEILKGTVENILGETNE